MSLFLIKCQSPWRRLAMTLELPPIGQADFVVVDEKQMHKGAMMGHISNGGGQISFPFGYGIRFVRREGSDFVTIQIINAGCGKKVQNQQWSRTKTKVVKKVVEKKVNIPKKETVQMKVFGLKQDGEERVL